MAKLKSFYTCQVCGYSAPKWLGKCPECAGWNTLVEEKATSGGRKNLSIVSSSVKPSPITELYGTAEDRLESGIGEFDRVLGGGVVLGSGVLIGGEPGIGKSTLLLQAMGALAGKGHKVLYVSGEESTRQIRLRGERLGELSENLLVWSETSVESILDMMKEMKPAVVVVDSVQTLYSASLESSPGSVSQVREVAAKLIYTAKGMDMPIFLVGHVTKDGAIAGPKVLEHMVDTVLYFEGESAHAFRVLRSAKNRYGSISEIGVFEMKDKGLEEVSNPSEIFLSERPVGATGSCVVSSLEGTRTILVELQGLVCQSVFGVPRRTVEGVDYNKVLLLCAVLEKKAGIALAGSDVFIKVAGGMRLDEPAVDLAIVASIASNFLDKPVNPTTVVFGEVGLAGEVRAVPQAAPRVNEAAKLGFKKCVLPRDCLKGLPKRAGIKLVGVSTVKEAIDEFFN